MRGSASVAYVGRSLPSAQAAELRHEFARPRETNWHEAIACDWTKQLQTANLEHQLFHWQLERNHTPLALTSSCLSLPP